MCVCVCEQFADLNDSNSVEDYCSSKQPLNDSKFTDNVDINSNALVEPNRETAAKDGSRAISSPSMSRLNPAAAVSTDTELTSVTHMLDVASSTNFRTLLAPSLTPPKSVISIATKNEKTAMPDDSVSVETAESVVEAIARDVVHRNKVTSRLYQ